MLDIDSLIFNPIYFKVPVFSILLFWQFLVQFSIEKSHKIMKNKTKGTLVHERG